MMNIYLTAMFCVIIYPYLYYGLEKLFSDIAYIAKWLIFLLAIMYIRTVKWIRRWKKQ